MGGLRAQPQPGRPGRQTTGSLAVRRRLGPFRAAYEPGDRAGAGAADCRRKQMTTARKARPTAISFSAPECANIVCRLQRVRSRPVAAPAGCWRKWSWTARRRSTCGWPISAAFPICTATATARPHARGGKHNIGFPHENSESGRLRSRRRWRARLKAHWWCRLQAGWSGRTGLFMTASRRSIYLRAGRTGSGRLYEDTPMCARRLVLSDQSSFAKYELTGKERAALD